MKLILVRHGETVENATGFHIGHEHGSLSDIGREQAKKLSNRLKDEKIDFIYSSDLKRAVDTTKEIAKHHPDTPFITTKELRERHWGIYSNRSHIDIGWGKIKKDYNLYSKPKDGENLDHIYKRADDFLHKILKEHPDDTVLLSIHNEIKKAFLCVITGKEPRDIFGMKSYPNTCVSIFEIDENRNHHIHIIGCAKHLEENL